MKRSLLAALVAVAFVTLSTVSAQQSPFNATYSGGSTPPSYTGAVYVATFDFTAQQIKLSGNGTTITQPFNFADGTFYSFTLNVVPVADSSSRTVSILGSGVTSPFSVVVNNSGSVLTEAAYAGQSAEFRNPTFGNATIGSLSGNAYGTTNALHADSDDTNRRLARVDVSGPDFTSGYNVQFNVQASGLNSSNLGSSYASIGEVTPVPEPATWIAGLVGGCMLAVVFVCRKRRRRKIISSFTY